MNLRLRPTTTAALVFPFLLTGCLLFPTTRKLPIPKGPLVVQNKTPEDLVAQLNDRWNAFTSLTAKVEMKASVIKSKEGLAKDYSSVTGHILIRKPKDLRVLFTYLGVRAFDMVYDGRRFTLYIPPNSKVIRGSNAVKKKSANTLENLRPEFFLDAMIVRGLEPDDHYSVTSASKMDEDAAKKHLVSVPEYILSITLPKPGTQEEIPKRVVYFHRDDLLPYQQDIYDAEGNLETQVFYSNYQNFDGANYPSSVTIKRPLEEIQVILTVDSVKENVPLSDDQFSIKIPEGTKTQDLD